VETFHGSGKFAFGGKPTDKLPVLGQIMTHHNALVNKINLILHYAGSQQVSLGGTREGDGGFFERLSTARVQLAKFQQGVNECLPSFSVNSEDGISYKDNIISLNLLYKILLRDRQEISWQILLCVSGKALRVQSRITLRFAPHFFQPRQVAAHGIEDDLLLYFERLGTVFGPAQGVLEM